MNDLSIDIMRVAVPRPIVFPDPDNISRLPIPKAYLMTHLERDMYAESKKAVFEPIALWGPLERPDFVIDEAELPY
jgi:hypothetical protein